MEWSKAVPAAFFISFHLHGLLHFVDLPVSSKVVQGNPYLQGGTRSRKEGIRKSDVDKAGEGIQRFFWVKDEKEYIACVHSSCLMLLFRGFLVFCRLERQQDEHVWQK